MPQYNKNGEITKMKVRVTTGGQKGGMNMNMLMEKG